MKMAPQSNTAHGKTNRLAREKSPYLLQHAHNPVDWFPWGAEAFEKARRENKPIFLSVGYSTCHWCHVMERESFENEEIAKILNAHFVAIKLDREERPDVDRVYMTFVQATTGGGGWPMSVFLTPDLKPFFGGTYFPPEDKWGRPGFKTVLARIHELWQRDREKLARSGDELVKRLQEMTAVGGAQGRPDATVLDTAFKQFASIYEPSYGGFGGAPKFPRPSVLHFLMRYYARTGKREALEMTVHTLRKMADGGMHDHLGGGFARYSVDNEWHVPHFEKMLYDQAQLACAYLEAYQLTHDPSFADTARDILDYVLRDMTGKDGQFFSAEDADSPLPNAPSEKGEGAFYVWEQKEIVPALGEDAVAVFIFYYGVKAGGNVASDPHGELTNKNVLIVSATIDETAKKFGKSADEIRAMLDQSRKKLFEVRANRPRPHLDDKTLTAWNGLMISALARASVVLGASATNAPNRGGDAAPTSKYRDAAVRAALFIEQNLCDKKTGRLLRRYRDGESAIAGYADDYAFYIQGLIDLYEATFDVRWLSRAIELQRKQNELFWDGEHGGFFTTDGSDATVLLRMKEDYDGAEPSPNSVSVLNLLRLAQMTDNAEFRAFAEKTLAAFGSNLQQSPSALPQMLCALDFALAKPKQIVVAGKPDADDTRAMLRAVHSQFLPNKILLFADGGEGQKLLSQFLPFVEGVTMKDGKATAYVCEDYACKLPTNEVEELRAQLL
jgi:uncharacterized protein YyaL (SSP411 family)